MVVALSGAMQGCSSVDASRDSQTSHTKSIRIGAILSLSGTYASMGEVEKQALDLETQRINAAGGIKGHPLEIIIENDTTDESKAVSAAEKLISKDKVVALLGATGTGPTMAVRASVEKAQIPQLSMAGGNVITGQFSPNVFQTPWTNKLLISTLFADLKAQGISRVALVTDSGGYGKDGRIIAQEEARKQGISLVLDTTFKPGDTDMSSQVALVKKTRPQAVVIWNAGKEAPLFVKQARLAGVTSAFFGGSGQAKSEFIEGAQKSAEDFTIITGKSFVPSSWKENSNQKRAMQDFSARFNEEYNSDPDIFAGHAYDALYLVVKALERMPNDDLEALASGSASSSVRSSLLKNIENTQDFYGFGGTFAFTGSNHNGLSKNDVTYFHVKEGEWVEGFGTQSNSAGTAQTLLGQILDVVFSTLKNASLYALIALGFVVIYLTTGSINFAQGEFVALGGLSAALLVGLGLPLPAACALTLLLAIGLGVLFNSALIAPLLKGARKHFVVRVVIITIGASVLLRQFALHLFGPDELALSPFIEAAPLRIGGAQLEMQTIILVAVTLLVFALFALSYYRSKFGRSMRAYQQSPMGAELVGVDARKVVRNSVVLSTLLGALAGILVTPLTQMSFDSGVTLGIKGFTVALLGGLTNPLFALVGAVILAAVETITGLLIDPLYKDVVAYVLLIILLIFRPQGLFSRARKEKL